MFGIIIHTNKGVQRAKGACCTVTGAGAEIQNQNISTLYTRAKYWFSTLVQDLTMTMQKEEKLLRTKFRNK